MPKAVRLGSGVHGSAPGVARRYLRGSSALCNDEHIDYVVTATDVATDRQDARTMPTPTTFLHPAQLPANVRPRVRLQLRLAGHLVPYVRPVVVLTNQAGARI